MLAAMRDSKASREKVAEGRSVAIDSSVVYQRSNSTDRLEIEPAKGGRGEIVGRASVLQRPWAGPLPSDSRISDCAFEGFAAGI